MSGDVTTGRQRDAGLSLVEVLAVLAIVGAMSGVAVLGLGALDRDASGEAEATRLAARLRLAVDEALATAAPLALIWDERGYRFLAWDAAAARWQPSAQRDLGRRHDLPASLRLTGEGQGGGPVMIAADRPQPPVVLHVDGGEPWQVAFDGLGAAVTAGHD